MQKLLRDGLESRSYPHFIIPGSHAIIYPWAPPLSPALPEELLLQLQKRLIDILEEVAATAHRRKRASQQSAVFEDSSDNDSDHSFDKEIDPAFAQQYL